MPAIPDLDLTAEAYAAARKLRGTQAEIADALGVNRVTVAKRETGGQVITREAVLALTALPVKRARRKGASANAAGGRQ